MRDNVLGDVNSCFSASIWLKRGLVEDQNRSSDDCHVRHRTRFSHRGASSWISPTLSIDAAMLGAMTTVGFAVFTTARVER
jgi:hypothetical protein